MEHEWTVAELVAQLRNDGGVRPGDILIVHSSAKEIGRAENGPSATVRALKEAVGPEGTLLLPVFSSPPADGIFKIKRTPSRVGLITEAFRRSEGVKRSMHPTHSVAAWGKRAEEFLAGHENTSALGPDSPFHKAAKAGAKILMIGCDFTTLSLIHVGEALAQVPWFGKGPVYGGYEKPLTLIDYEGKEHPYVPYNTPGDSVAFVNFQHEMERLGKISLFKVGDAETMVFDAATCLNVTVEMLQKDPGLALCKKSNCPVCVGAWTFVEQAQKPKGQGGCQCGCHK